MDIAQYQKQYFKRALYLLDNGFILNHQDSDDDSFEKELQFIHLENNVLVNIYEFDKFYIETNPNCLDFIGTIGTHLTNIK